MERACWGAVPPSEAGAVSERMASGGRKRGRSAFLLWLLLVTFLLLIPCRAYAAHGVDAADLVSAAGCAHAADRASAVQEMAAAQRKGAASAAKMLDPEGSYTSKEDVALFLHTYGKLPGNFITKKEARKLGWNGGDLTPYAPGKCIGGDRFGNYEGLLPKKQGRTYWECDIDTLGKKKRGAKRLIYSNDGLIYYTEDHYGSYTLLYDG